LDLNAASLQGDLAMDPLRSAATPVHYAARLEPDLVLLDIGCDGALPPGSTTLRVDGQAVPPPTAARLLPQGCSTLCGIRGESRAQQVRAEQRRRSGNRIPRWAEL